MRTMSSHVLDLETKLDVWGDNNLNENKEVLWIPFTPTLVSPFKLTWIHS